MNINIHTEELHSRLAEFRKPETPDFTVTDLEGDGSTIIIEPKGYEGDSLDGMQVLYEDGEYEVRQYSAGKCANELHTYLSTKNFGLAMRSMLKGNKNRKPIKIIN